MPAEDEIKDKFWDALKSDRTVMLRLSAPGDMARPMTAQVDDETPGSIWFFADRTDDLASGAGDGADCELAFADKGHDLFATVKGEIGVSDDPAMIDRLWSPFVAAWFEGGRDDPRLALLRMRAGAATIWLAETGLLTGAKMMLGMDVKADYQDKVAHTRLD